MKARIIRIGNSRGVRIPKALIEQAGLSGDVEIHLHNGGLLIRPPQNPREGWAEACAEMARAGEDLLLDDPLPPTRFDGEEWEW